MTRTIRAAVVHAEIFYLFNVCYLHASSFTLTGARGTPAVLALIAVLLALQALFTYAPFMQAIFDTRPLALGDGLLIVGVGFLLMVLLEAKKWLMRRLGWFAKLKE